MNKLSSKSIGITFMILSAGIFGFTPVLVRFAFEGGANSVTMIFLRATISLPLLAAIMLFMKIPFKVPRERMKEMFFGALGFALTGIFLYSAFYHINVGLAVTIHYTNPVLVMLVSVFFFREKMGMYKWIALALVMTGIVLLTGAIDSYNFVGIGFALMSAICVTSNILVVGRSKLHELHYLTITFYFILLQCIIAFSFGLAIGQLAFALTPAAWVYTAIVSILVSVFAVTLYQQGVLKAGSTTSSLVSCLEPITSIVFGAVFLAEILTPLNIIGGFMVISSVVIISLAKKE